MSQLANADRSKLNSYSMNGFRCVKCGLFRESVTALFAACKHRDCPHETKSHKETRERMEKALQEPPQ